MVAVPAPLRSNVLFNMLYRDVAAKVGVISLSSITLTELVLSRPISRSFKWNRIGIPGEITPETPYALMEFPTGKTYNADLNASYNIGARYFIRHLLKTVTETQRLALEAKVPQVAKRSTCTLSHLINLRSEFVALAAKTQA